MEKKLMKLSKMMMNETIVILTEHQGLKTKLKDNKTF